LSVRLSVLSVCSPHNSKTNDPKASKLDIGMTLGYPSSDMALKVEMSKVKVTGSMSAFYNNDYYVYVNANLIDSLTIVKRCANE